MFYSFFFILVVCLSIHSSLQKKKKKQLSCNFLAQMYKIKVNEIN
jgi:hypothetical protein